MDDQEAIARYDEAGRARAAAEGQLPVRWPDLALEPANLARLVEGVLGARLNFPMLAFGEDFDADACGERLSEAWRTDDLQVRYAPEGVFVRAKFSVLVELASDPDDEDDTGAAETVWVVCELCVSFTHRHHTRPFVDFMGGTVTRASDGATRALDPFAREIAPADAFEWGLNGTA